MRTICFTISELPAIQCFLIGLSFLRTGSALAALGLRLSLGSPLAFLGILILLMCFIPLIATHFLDLHFAKHNR